MLRIWQRRCPLDWINVTPLYTVTSNIHLQMTSANSAWRHACRLPFPFFHLFSVSSAWTISRDSFDRCISPSVSSAIEYRPSTVDSTLSLSLSLSLYAGLPIRSVLARSRSWREREGWKGGARQPIIRRCQLEWTRPLIPLPVCANRSRLARPNH